MSRRVVVIGAGMGGLACALSLARRGFAVTLLEARPYAGGLAGGLTLEGFEFDAGPYLLLDRPGLIWAFERLGLDLDALVPMRRVEDVYQVQPEAGACVAIHASLERTAVGLETKFPGSAAIYRQFVQRMERIRQDLLPQLLAPHRGVRGLLRGGAWRHALFLLRSLGSVLASSGLPQPVQDALGIWTHVAGQSLAQAPSPLAFVPALIHGPGAFLPDAGVRAVPAALARAVQAAGVEVRHATQVSRIECVAERVTSVVTSAGERMAADAVVSNHAAIGTHLDLLAGTGGRFRRRFLSTPLQSPGVCAYLAVRGDPPASYLRFRLPSQGLCRLLIRPPSVAGEDWAPARLLGPMRHAEATRLGEVGQRAYLDGLLGESWWREGLLEVRVLGTRVPHTWGEEFHLYRESMNPVMTARALREGRFPYRSPVVRGLYLTGSSTHPGQWVSFCAISGVLAADCVGADLG